jgi:hypothetical protein
MGTTFSHKGWVTLSGYSPLESSTFIYSRSSRLKEKPSIQWSRPSRLIYKLSIP